jgi:2-polyprenyl-3-methyl-5-hydroxy-6-metoxy-1,4-benzoquinol methylase
VELYFTLQPKRIELKPGNQQLKYSGVSISVLWTPGCLCYVDVMLDVVRAICPGSILDFGCGDGMFTQKLACEGGRLPALIFLLID